MKTKYLSRLLPLLLMAALALNACSRLQFHDTPKQSGSEPDATSTGAPASASATSSSSASTTWHLSSFATEPEETDRDVRHRVNISLVNVPAAAGETALALPLDGTETGLRKEINEYDVIFVGGEYAVAPNGHIIVADIAENRTILREYAEGSRIRTLTDPEEVGERPLWKSPTFWGDTFCATLYDYALSDPIYLMGDDGMLACADGPWNNSHALQSVCGTAAGHLILLDGGYNNSRIRIIDAAGSVLYAAENLRGQLTEDAAGNLVLLESDDDTATLSVTSPSGEPLSVCELLKPENTYLFWSLIGADELGNVYLLADPTSNMTDGYPDVYLIRLDPMTGEAQIAALSTMYGGIPLSGARLQVTPDGTVYRSECIEADGYRILRFDPWAEE